MTAAAIRRSERSEGLSGPRPVDPRHDMADIARLIEVSFGDRLDAAGRTVVREMRAFGRAGWLGWLVGRFFLPPAAYPLGYVWEEGGELIGNASVMPLEDGSGRWVMANVAVHPTYRRRGIARNLVQASLALAERRGAREVVLQVDHDNRAALTLYERLHFETLCARTTWLRRAESPEPPVGSDQVTERREDEWTQQWALAQKLFPEGLVWPHPLTKKWFAPSNMPSLFRSVSEEHGVIRGGHGELVASGTARFSRETSALRLALLVPPHRRGELEAPLLAWLIRRSSVTGLSLSLSYPAGAADEALERLGFRSRRTLTWMRTGLGTGRRSEN